MIQVLNYLVCFFLFSIGLTPSFAQADENREIKTAHGYLYVEYRGKVLKDEVYKPTRLTPQSPFPLGSTSKQITGLEILRMTKDPQYKLTPMTLLSDILPAAKGSNITIRDLLEHRSGLSKNPVKKDGLTDYSCDNQNLLNFQARRGNHISQNRTSFNYSNYNYCLLGKVIEKLKGEPFNQVMEEDFFGPLKMESTFAAKNTDSFPNLIGVGGCNTKGGLCEAHPQLIPGAGSIITTPNDFKKWVKVFRDQSLMGWDFYNKMKKRLLAATLGEEAHLGLRRSGLSERAKLQLLYARTPDDEILYTTEFSDSKDFEPYIYDYGLRFRIKNSYLSVAHTGTVAGHKAFVVYYPELDLFIFLFKDTSIRQSEPAEAFKMAKELLPLVSASALDEQNPTEPETKAKELQSDIMAAK